VSALPQLAPQRSDVGIAVLDHLDAQLASARCLLDAVLRQGVATRRQDVDAVLACLTQIQGEMERRGRLEEQRTKLLVSAAARLQRQPHEVTLDALASLMTAAEGQAAKERSAELRGLLAEIQREHHVNRALMRQELAFLDHLVRTFAADETPGYRPPAEHNTMAAVPMQRHRVLDLQA
jgi:SpoVK/Ycf46/Vps4 family AAA+-type ATPase